jgi:hypothetical protein
MRLTLRHPRTCRGTNQTRAAHPGRHAAPLLAAAGVPVNLDAIPRMACRTCTVPLNRCVDLHTGQVTYTHPLNTELEPVGHDPDPAPMDEIDTRQVCDFCGDERIAYTVLIMPITSIADTGSGRMVDRYGTDWSACFPVRRPPAGQGSGRPAPPAAAERSTAGPQGSRGCAGHVRAVLRSLLPGWTVAIGRWPATPLAAGILPQVRDRLATLLGGELGLPGPRRARDPRRGRGQRRHRAAVLDRPRVHRTRRLRRRVAAGHHTAPPTFPPRTACYWPGPTRWAHAPTWSPRRGAAARTGCGWWATAASAPACHPPNFSICANSSAGSVPASTRTCRPAIRSTRPVPRRCWWRPGC